MTAPYQRVCSSGEFVSVPINRGKTGMINPMPRASRRTQASTNLTAGRWEDIKDEANEGAGSGRTPRPSPENRGSEKKYTVFGPQVLK